jgi:diguanylate cyclase (GGDEF)-like protein
MATEPETPFRWVIPTVSTTGEERQAAQQVPAASLEPASPETAEPEVKLVYDPLTGLLPRRLFEDLLERELARHRRGGSSLALVVVFFRDLRAINEAHGRAEGDRLLREAAEALTSWMRQSDLAFRISGDELALITPEVRSSRLAGLEARLRARLREAFANDPEFFAGLQLGSAIGPLEGASPAELLAMARQRLSSMTAVAPAPASAESLEEGVRLRVVNVSDNRQHERISLADARAYVVVVDSHPRIARVLDMSYGGLKLQFERETDLPEQFLVDLHVPVLPQMRVRLRRAYCASPDGRAMIVGCSFF